MTAGVRVFGVDRRGECPHNAAEEFGLFVVQGDVAAMNAEDRGHAGHQAGFNRAELGFAVRDVARAGVIQCEYPAEQSIAFADRDADDLAHIRIEPGWRAGRAAVEHERFGGDARTQSFDELFKVTLFKRTIAVRDEHRLAVAALSVLALQMLERAEPNGYGLGRDHVVQPVDGHFANVRDALGDRQVFGQAMQERDFLERHQEVRGNVGQLPLHLSGRLLHRRFFEDRGAHFLDRLGRPRALGLGPAECLADIDAECGGGRGDLCFALDTLSEERRDGDHHGSGICRRQWDGQH